MPEIRPNAKVLDSCSSWIDSSLALILIDARAENGFSISSLLRSSRPPNSSAWISPRVRRELPADSTSGMAPFNWPLKRQLNTSVNLALQPLGVGGKR
jgi:hypothetical protein